MGSLNQDRIGCTEGVAHENSTGWVGELRLGFAKRGDRTTLVHRWHRGPLQVQRPFYPEGSGVCHLYLLHPPGGVVPGDQLSVQARVESGAEVLLTTPASTKVYRSHGPTSSQSNQLFVDGNGGLEWFPQETIVFNGARTELSTRVDLSGDQGGFTGWEILCLGCPASGDPFKKGSCRQSFEVWRDQNPLWIDRCKYDGGSFLLREAWGLGGASVVGTMICVTDEVGLLEELRSFYEALPSASYRVVATQLRDVVVVRYLGHHAEEAKEIFAGLWSVSREWLSGRSVCEPRIWKT